MKDITMNLFKVKSDLTAPSCSRLLVADPFLKEAYFNHGVIALIDYLPSDGATGVVMNNRTEFTLRDLLDGIDESIDIPVYCGGPVGQDRLFFIHTLGPDIIPRARRFAPGLYVGGDFDAVVDYINSGYTDDGAVRFFVGYSTWDEGQLEKELRSEKWAQADSPRQPSELLCGSGDSYWHRIVRSLGEPYRSWRLMPRNVAAN